MTPERDARLLEQAQAITGTDVVRLLELVAAALEATANGAQARIQLELVLIKAAAPEVDPSTTALLARIERLEDALARGCHASGPLAAATEPRSRGRRPCPLPGRRASPLPGRRAVRQLSRGRRPSPPRRPPPPLPSRPSRRRPTPRPSSTPWSQSWPAVVDFVRQGNAMLAATARRRPPGGAQRPGADARLPERSGVPQAQGRAGRLPPRRRRGGRAR